MSVATKQWFMHVLARMGQRAKCLCGTDTLRELGEGLRMTELDITERIAIIDELDRMLQQDAGEYEQASITYLKQLIKQLEEQPWYMIALERMADHSKGGGIMQVLLETGEDVKLSEMTENDRESIVCEIDRMLREESNVYTHNANQYLKLLRHQIAGGF